MSAGKAFRRAAAWDWYEKARTQVCADRSCRDSRECYLQAAVIGDRLLIGCWGRRDGEPRGLYLMTRSGGHSATVDGKTWTQTGLWSLCTGSSWYYYDDSDRMMWLAGEEAARAFLDGISGRDGHSRLSITDSIKRREETLSRNRREVCRQNRQARIDTFADGLPPLPDDFEDFLRNVAFGGREYAFRREDVPVGVSGQGRGFACTACGGIHTGRAFAGWKRNTVQICPATGRQVTVRAGYGDELRAQERVMLISPAPAPQKSPWEGRMCAVARHFTAERVWTGFPSGGESELNLYPDALLVLPPDGTACNSKYIYYRVWNSWSESNPCMLQSGNGYAYPDMTALAGTAYERMGLDTAAKAHLKLNWNNLMRDWHDDARAEYLIKGGFGRLMADLCDARIPVYRNTVLRSVPPGEAASARAVLGLSGQGVARLRQRDGGAYHAVWLRTAERCGYALSDEVWDGLCNLKLTPDRVSVALECGLSPERIWRYLLRQRAENPGAASQVPELWRDTLDMGKRLKLDLSSDAVLRPRNLRARHDELVVLIAAEADRLLAEKQEETYPAIRPICDSIRATYTWSDGTHTVVVPAGAADIIREGRLLRHCVGSNERYFDRMAARESYILFLRRAASPDTPWYTIEAEPGGHIRQLRTLGDSEGSDRGEAKEALRAWKAAIRPRLDAAERELASVSKEARLAEFDALRQGGNVIRAGNLKGRLLADVLEQDSRELNDQDEDTRVDTRNERAG